MTKKEKIIRILDILGINNKYIHRKMYQYQSSERAFSDDRKKKLDRESFFKPLLNPGDLVFDVGANIGDIVEPLLNQGCKIIAFEPQDECLKILKNRFKHEKNSQLVLDKRALGAKVGNVDFYECLASSSSSTFSTQWIKAMKEDKLKYVNWNLHSTKEMTTLDQVIKQYGKPRFCKIDVEGYEYEVFQGLSQPIDLISFEYTVPEAIDTISNCIHHLLKLNPDYTFNYSIGVSMRFVFPSFIRGGDFLEHMKNEKFLNNASYIFGDVYVASEDFIQSFL